MLEILIPLHLTQMKAIQNIHKGRDVREKIPESESEEFNRAKNDLDIIYEYFVNKGSVQDGDTIVFKDKNTRAEIARRNKITTNYLGQKAKVKIETEGRRTEAKQELMKSDTGMTVMPLVEKTVEEKPTKESEEYAEELRRIGLDKDTILGMVSLKEQRKREEEQKKPIVSDQGIRLTWEDIQKRREEERQAEQNKRKMEDEKQKKEIEDWEKTNPPPTDKKIKENLDLESISKYELIVGNRLFKRNKYDQTTSEKRWFIRLTDVNTNDTTVVDTTDWEEADYNSYRLITHKIAGIDRPLRIITVERPEVVNRVWEAGRAIREYKAFQEYREWYLAGKIDKSSDIYRIMSQNPTYYKGIFRGYDI